jgi:hypothetical protein
MRKAFCAVMMALTVLALSSTSGSVSANPIHSPDKRIDHVRIQQVPFHDPGKVGWHSQQVPFHDPSKIVHYRMVPFGSGNRVNPKLAV